MDDVRNIVNVIRYEVLPCGVYNVGRLCCTSETKIISYINYTPIN